MRMAAIALLLLGGFAALAFAATGAASTPQGAEQRSDDQIPGRYIVVYRDSVESVNRATERRERSVGFRSRFRYRSALKGFAARLSSSQVRKLRDDPAVDFVSADRVVRASAELAEGDTAPTGVRRIEAASFTSVRGASAVGVAVIDTGIDLSHPDLNVESGKNCVSTGAGAQDDEGHGTHVAGTIAARNNGSGVVGVAPATKLYAVKVLDQKGSGTWSQVVCGIDWVTQNAESKGIRVANMSLGGGGSPVGSCDTTTDAMHKAICASTEEAGVVYTVAAGNSGWDYDYEPVPDVPAAYPEVLTVTALSDTDGIPGALGANCGRGRFAERDDRHASFSNYAALQASHSHTLAAPGVCIVSDKLGGGTTSMSGTSMAAPHVAGAVALCIREDGQANGSCASLAAHVPSQFITEITRTDPDYGFYGDPNDPVSGRYYGYLTWVGLSSGSTNLLLDTGVTPDFEDDAAGWRNLGPGVTVARDTADPISGAGSLKVVTPGSRVNEGARTAPTTAIPVTANETYRAEVTVRAPVDARMLLVIDERDSSGSLVTNHKRSFVGTGKAETVATKVSFGSTGEHASVVIRNRLTAQAHTFHVDDVALYGVSGTGG
jgi:subtilisin